jgi:DNA-binding NtrC family response regulator
LSIERAIAHRALGEEIKRLREEVQHARPIEDMAGASPAMRDIADLISRVAETDATVLVTGESGSGKELVARAIHSRSRRAGGPLVTINCAAMPETLLESELFGHTKGAFTDAKSARRGLLLEASGGTLFLDELGEMPIGMQAKLLRALEERKVRPVGGSAEVEFDARIVTATNRDLEALVEEKRFREDLFYRVNVVHIEVPPLRSRGNDVLLLAQIFLERFSERHGKRVSGYHKEVAERLLAYSWPGNVRELQNSMERAVALARFEQLTVEDLPPKIRDYRPNRIVFESDDPAELVTIDDLERRYIQRVMEAVGWNKANATRVLGIDRSTLYRKLERYGITQPK